MGTLNLWKCGQKTGYISDKQTRKFEAKPFFKKCISGKNKEGELNVGFSQQSLCRISYQTDRHENCARSTAELIARNWITPPLEISCFSNWPDMARAFPNREAKKVKIGNTCNYIPRTHTACSIYFIFKKEMLLERGKLRVASFFDKSPRNQRRRFHGIFLKIVQTGEEQTDRQTDTDFYLFLRCDFARLRLFRSSGKHLIWQPNSAFLYLSRPL